MSCKSADVEEGEELPLDEKVKLLGKDECYFSLDVVL